MESILMFGMGAAMPICRIRKHQRKYRSGKLWCKAGNAVLADRSVWGRDAGAAAEG